MHNMTARSVQTQAALLTAYQPNPLLNPVCSCYSIIAPVHHEKRVLAVFYRRVCDVMRRTGEDCELTLLRQQRGLEK